MTDRYSIGPLSQRTLELMAQGCTKAQWLRQCTEGVQLQLIDDDGGLLTGQALFDKFKHLCRKEEA